MGVVQQLLEELRAAIKRKKRVEQELKSLDFSITVMRKELNARMPLAH